VHTLANVTVADNGSGVVLNNALSRVENSLIIGNTYSGLAAGSVSPVTRYNDVWGNGTNYTGLTPGLGDLSLDPRFVDPGQGDYRLQIGSPVVDAGDPNALFNDRDGSRNETGAYGGPGAPAYVLSRADAPIHSLGAFTVSWQGRAADGVAGYDVQYRVGPSGLWQDWLSDVTGLSAPFGPSDPVSVTLGNVYCFRSRGRDGVGNLEPYPPAQDACTSVTDKIIYLPIVMKR
jgi:hypothetical protein